MLLRNLPQSEFPSEYLLPRLLARNAAAAASVQGCLDGDNPVPWATDQDIAGQLQAERFWLYHQLHSRLRCDLGPLFLFFELKTLVNWLRVRQARASGALLHSFLPQSLLCPELLKALQDEEEPKALAERLEKFLCTRLDPGFSGLAEGYKKKGLLAFEGQLYQLYFERIGLAAPEATVRSFFKGLVDQRNILALAKANLWQEKMTFVDGGYLAVNWERVLAEPKRADRVLARLQWESGLPREAQELSALEDFLLHRLCRILQRQARNGTKERIIHYLWQPDIHARNMGLLLHGRLVGGELLAAKVIQ